VIKLNDLELQKKLGFTGIKAPSGRWPINSNPKRKRPSWEEVSLSGWQNWRNNPCGTSETCFHSGSTVSRATMANEDEEIRLDLPPGGDRVLES
jgi:NAD-dependent DNA ligase